MKRVAVLLAAALAWLGTAAPAEARLGDSFIRFRGSALIAGDTLFRYEGRIGSRFRFGPAPRCRIGTALLMIDCVDGMIVQQTIILPLPHVTRDMVRMDEIATLFLEDAGLGKVEMSEAIAAFRESYTTAKPIERTIGPDKRLNLNSFTSPQLAHVLLAVGIKPDGAATPAPEDEP